MTPAQLTKLKIDPSWAEPLDVACEAFGINTPARQAAFIGQCSHESNHFKTLEENLNYSAEALTRVWPGRFPTLESAQPYHRQPMMIANKVYADRLGNGPEASGEGWQYRGRGLIQLTGKENYRKASEALSVDLVEDPDLVATPELAALTAAWFWKTRGLNELADAGNHTAITKRINGGTLGMNERLTHTKLALAVLNGDSTAYV